MFLIAGLGNPGSDFANTRHNAGFLAAEKIAFTYGIPFNLSECRSLCGKGEISGQKVVLAKPLTYMNKSGLAIKCLIEKYDFKPDRIIVIYDDLDLPVGRIRIREKGSSGGHRGVQSIITELGTDEFIRVRIGIGRPEAGNVDIVEYVLSPFDDYQRKVFEQALEDVVEAVETIISKGVHTAMSIFNRKQR